MTTVVSELANKWFPLPPEKFFSPQRAPDMWFSDELPPTWQEQMSNPLVTQVKFAAQLQVLRNLAEHEQHRTALARSRKGKRAKAARN